MSLAFERAPDRMRVHMADDPAALASIHEPDVNLAIWRRTDAPRFVGLAAHMATHAHDPEAEEPVVSRSGSLRDCARAAAELIGCDDDSADVLRDELRLLVPLFCRIARVNSARVRFDFLAHDGCKKFHCDWVGLRLLSTYHGPGTEYLPEHAVKRAMLGRGTNDQICRDPSAIRRMPRGHVGLFKGEAYPGNAGQGIVHRSSPISGTGKTRLLLVLNSA